MKLTQKILKECLEYNPITGDFTWLVDRGNRKCRGLIAGTIKTTGYRCIGINGMFYFEHRLAFLYMTGNMPEVCDHINRIPDDNRWSNLRPTTRLGNSQNKSIGRNNTSGYAGVSYSKKIGKFTAKIKINGKVKQLGTFTCKHHAFCEYVLAARKYFGEFSPV